MQFFYTDEKQNFVGPKTYFTYIIQILNLNFVGRKTYELNL